MSTAPLHSDAYKHGNYPNLAELTIPEGTTYLEFINDVDITAKSAQEVEGRKQFRRLITQMALGYMYGFHIQSSMTYNDGTLSQEMIYYLLEEYKKYCLSSNIPHLGYIVYYDVGAYQNSTAQEEYLMIGSFYNEIKYSLISDMLNAGAMIPPEWFIFKLPSDKTLERETYNYVTNNNTTCKIEGPFVYTKDIQDFSGVLKLYGYVNSDNTITIYNGDTIE